MKNKVNAVIVLCIGAAIVLGCSGRRNEQTNGKSLIIDHSAPAPTIDPSYVPRTPKPKTAAQIQSEAVEARKLYIQNKERDLLDSGMDVYLSLKGKRQDQLQMKYILMSRPMVHKLSQDENFLSTVRGLGFTKVIFTDGYNDTWTMDL